MTVLSTTATATEAAILAAGLRTRYEGTLTGLDFFSPPNPNAIVFACGDSKAVDLSVSFHLDPRARTIELAVDRANAPLTGNYVLVIGATTSMYDATSGSPADVDALLTAWAAQIESDLSGYTATPVATITGGDLDAVRVTAPTTTGDYATFVVATGTAAPALAALELRREIDSASLRIWTRNGSELPDALTWDPIQSAQAQGWKLAADLGALDYGGYDQRLDLASRSAVWPQLHTAVHTDTVATTGSGAGVYTITNMVACVAAPQVAP